MNVVKAPVLYNVRETPTVYRLGLAYDALSRGVRPAQFVMLALPELEQQLVPRPFSVSDAFLDAQGREVAEFLYKPLGRVTRLFPRLGPGDELRVGGLAGNGFPDPVRGRPVMVAGGIGNAPFALLVRRLAGETAGKPLERSVMLLGGRSAADIYIQPAVREVGVRILPVTEDGSLGEQGLVTAPLVRLLQEGGPVEVYGCGPTPMLRALQGLALEHGFAAHLALEEHMACGYGVCNACVVERRVPDRPRGEGPYARLCTEGPVFEAREVHI